MINAPIIVTRDVAPAQDRNGSSTAIAELSNTSGSRSKADNFAAQRFRSMPDVCAGSWVAVTGQSTGFNRFLPRIWEDCHFTRKCQRGLAGASTHVRRRPPSEAASSRQKSSRRRLSSDLPSTRSKALDGICPRCVRDATRDTGRETRSNSFLELFGIV